MWAAFQAPHTAACGASLLGASSCPGQEHAQCQGVALQPQGGKQELWGCFHMPLQHHLWGPGRAEGLGCDHPAVRQSPVP